MLHIPPRIWLAGVLLAVFLLTGSTSAQGIVYPPAASPRPSNGAASTGEDRPSYYNEDYSGTESDNAPLDKQTAEIRVRLPANAELWSNGKKTKLTGTVREFVTPRLDEERVYTYVLKARWREDGFTVEKTLRVRTFAGSRVTVNFVRPPASVPARPTVVRSEPPGIALPPVEVEQKPIEWTAPRSLGLRPY